MKKIYFDFETTSPNPLKAEILEAAFIFVEDGEVIEKIVSNITLKKSWNEFDEDELETLAFNNINSEEDYFEHQKLSNCWNQLHSYLIRYYVEMFQDYDEVKDKPIKIPLSGWNNAGFDNVILQRVFPEYKDYFDYHTRDIMHRFQILKEIGMIKGLSLSKCHQELIGTEKSENFHNALIDCYATKDLDEWFEKHIMEEIKQ